MAIYIVSDQESIGSRIREVLSFEQRLAPVTQILSIATACQRIVHDKPVDLIVVSLPSDLESGLSILPALSRVAPGKVIVVGPTTDSKIVLRALRSGAIDFVDVAELEVELKCAIERTEKAASGPLQSGRVIAVLGPTGGAGASTLAVSLAVALAKQAKTCGLIDLKLESGDLAAMLDLTPTFSLADLARSFTELDRAMLERALVKHDSGVNLLVSSIELADVALVRPENVSRSLSLTRASFPFVVVDVDHSFRIEQRAVLEEADLILIVFRLDFNSLRHVRRTVEYLARNNVSQDRIRIVVNRYGQPQEVPVAKAEEALGMKIFHFVCEDAKAVNRANNRGVPVVLDAPSAKVSKNLLQLATNLQGVLKQ